jgi:hypothetical protein
MPASVKAERIKWLDLSKPSSPAGEGAPARGASPCPGCGWPVAPGAEACAHCGRPPAHQPVGDILATLDVEPLPRVVEVTPAPDGWFDGAPPDPPAIYDLRLQAERLCVTTGNVDPNSLLLQAFGIH